MRATDDDVGDAARDGVSARETPVAVSFVLSSVADFGSWQLQKSWKSGERRRERGEEERRRGRREGRRRRVTGYSGSTLHHNQH